MFERVHAPPPSARAPSPYAWGPPPKPPPSRWPVALASILFVVLLAGSAFLLVGRDEAETVPDGTGDEGRAVALQNVKNLLDWHRDLVTANRRYPPVGGKGFVLWPLVS